MAVKTALGFGDDEIFEPVTTWEGLHTFMAAQRPVPPPALDERWTLESLRDYHSRFVVLTTPAVEQATQQLHALAGLNRCQQGTARRGLIVSGPPGTGKSTTLLELARHFYRAGQLKWPDFDSQLPVVYVMVPPSYTPKNLVKEFARFLGIPLHRRMNEADITEAVCRVLCQRRTRLVLIDDVHLINTRTHDGAETSDQIKHLTERVPATFVLAGIDVEYSPLLSGVRGQQLAARYKLVRTTPLPHGTAQEKEIWRALARDLDAALRLRFHRKGTLVRLAPYLHRRTGGVMASLSQLVREAALASLSDGSHALTRKHLDAVQLDVRASRGDRP
ncbi:AAA family ATPase [Streptomyces sp. NPDC056486]|uniref:AAA family ATPase n=1 Tax=Streptomyces sp. NPDC056486 TaxID=3345835 RepID=UPI00369991F9